MAIVVACDDKFGEVGNDDDKHLNIKYIIIIISDMIERTVTIEKKQLEIEEKGVRLKLTIVDTPGFNDAVNAENW